MDTSRALEFTRYNSGTNILDSGGTSGRVWQSPPDGQSDVIMDDDPHYCSISVTAMLADMFTEDDETTDNLMAYADENEDMSWFEVSDAYFEDNGYTQLARDNTYNGEHSLSQEYVWEVWANPGCDPCDWIYADDSEVTVVLFLHTGADVRGGYSKPLVGNFDGDYSIPVDTSLEWYLTPMDDDSELPEWAEDINDRGELSSGYSSAPLYHAEELGITWADDCRKGEGFVVSTEGDTEQVVMVPSRPYMGE